MASSSSMEDAPPASQSSAPPQSNAATDIRSPPPPGPPPPPPPGSASPSNEPPPPSSASSPDVVGPIQYGSVRRGPTFLSPRPRSPPAPALPSPSPPPPSPRYVVFALGSRTLRYGTADDFQPKQKAMAIAYRTTPPTHAPVHDDEKSAVLHPSPPSPEDSWWREYTAASFARVHPDVVRRRVKPPPKPKFFDDFDAVPVYEEGGATTRVDLPVDDAPWADVSAGPSFITGDPALTVHPREPYALFFPIQRGHLNVTVGAPSPSALPPFTAPNTSYTASLAAIETILYDTLVEDLRVPAGSLGQVCAVLSLPSTFSYRETFDVASLLLDRLRVKELLVHNEAVLATYGSGLASACVVDIGQHVTRVCCVEDGLVVAGSEVQAEYGGDDLGELLFEWMKAHDHYMGLRHVQARQDWWTWLQVQRAKEKVLTASMRDFHYQWVEFRELRPAGGVRVHRMNVSSAAVLTPRALFEPSLLRRWKEPGAIVPPWTNSAVFDAVMDDIIRSSVFYAFTREYETRKDRPRRDIWEQVRRQAETPDAAAVAKEADGAVEERKEELQLLEKVDGRRRKRKNDAATSAFPPRLAGEPAASGRSPSPPPTGSSPSPAPWLSEEPPSLAQLIAQSINRVSSVSLRRRLCLSILMTGSTCKTPHMVDFCTAQLTQALPPLMETTLTPGRSSGDEVQCIQGQKLVEVGCEAWKGGAVLAGIRLELLGTGAKDRWMAREEWIRNPQRTLRERCPFVV